MSDTAPYRIKTISELHQFYGVPKPEHPLLSIIDIYPFEEIPAAMPGLVTADFYIISLKKGFDPAIKIRYGQQVYDFDEGVLSFMAPGQVFGVDSRKYASPQQSGWMLLVHPDLLWDTALAKKIRQYQFFGYAVHEALFLSDKEEKILGQLIGHIKEEYHARIDKFSKQIVIAHIDALLGYAERFYERQFLTRSLPRHQLLEQLEQVLAGQLNDEALLANGLPSVQAIAGALHMSPDYLSGMLKSLTGLSTQQYLHEKLIEKAKLLLSTTALSVSEIAYALGFEHPQSFNRLFKTKTQQSPLAFRQLHQ